MPKRPATSMIEDEFGDPKPADPPKPAPDSAAPTNDAPAPRRGQRSPKS